MRARTGQTDRYIDLLVHPFACARVERAIDLHREIAVFEMGSTVVLLFAPGMKPSARLQAGLPIKLGEALE